MTPLDAITSVFVTCVDPFRKTFPPRTETFTEGPASVSTCLPFRGGDGGRGEVALHDVIEQDRLEQGRVAPDLLERGVRQLRGRGIRGSEDRERAGLVKGACTARLLQERDERANCCADAAVCVIGLLREGAAEIGTTRAAAATATAPTVTSALDIILLRSGLVTILCSSSRGLCQTSMHLA